MGIELLYITDAILGTIAVGILIRIGSYLIGGFFQLVIIAYFQLHTAHLVRLPVVQAIHQVEVGKQE